MPLRNDTAVATKFRWEDHRTIAHALGGLAGKDYLNSREGFLAMYEQGVRLFELDLSRTSDGVWVCRHNWKESMGQWKGSGKKVLTEKQDNTWYPSSNSGPTMFGYKGTEHEDLVKEFFNFVTTTESLQEILDNSPAYTNLDVNDDKLEQHWLPEEQEFLKTVPDDKKAVVTLQTGTKYTNDYWTQFGQDMVAFCQGEMEANDVLKNMDTNRAEAAKTVGDENWK